MHLSIRSRLFSSTIRTDKKVIAEAFEDPKRKEKSNHNGSLG